MNLQLLASFPKSFEPNEAQSLILNEIGIALEQGKKFIIINAPTATGKSFIAKTIANYSSDPSDEFIKAAYNGKEVENPMAERFGTAILTVTKSLQDQYGGLFEDGSVLKGADNYPCAVSDIYSCGSGYCSWNPGQYKKCKAGRKCPYMNQKANTVINKCAFYNYAMFEALSEDLKYKDFIICDEASEIEAELVSRYTFEIVYKDIKKIADTMPRIPDEIEGVTAFYEWGCKMSAICNSMLEKYKEYIEKVVQNKAETSRPKTKLNKEESAKLGLLQHYADLFNHFVEAYNYTTYLVTKGADSVILQPYNVDGLANNIFKFGSTVILMSATIVNPAKFAKTLGIKDYYYIEAKTTLESEKAPIKCMSKYRVNYSNKNTVVPILAKVAKAICDKHAGQKGLIHTHSMDILSTIKREFGEDTRFLYREPGVTNEKILETHSNTTADTVLVSPSMTHGIDLKGDLGQFQIIMKAPYLPLGDKRIKKKFDEDKEWYSDAMLSTLIQMAGRCNRIASDYAVTYILDGSIVDAVLKNKDKLPKYFINRFN